MIELVSIYIENENNGWLRIERQVMEIRLSKTELMILSTVQNEGRLYGLDIRERIAEKTAGAVKMSLGSLYPALRRLEAKGLVDSEWGDEETDERGPRRRYYSIRGLGKRVLREHTNVLLSILTPRLTEN